MADRKRRSHEAPHGGLRDHGYGKPADTVGVPRLIEGLSGPACPNCGAPKTFLIKIDVIEPKLKGGTGVGLYLGCAACPFASAVLAVAGPHEAQED